MAQTGSEREARLDLLLGQAALEHGFITPEQLRDALAEQALGVARGRKLPRPIGVILASRKWVSDSQLSDLTRELEQRFRKESEEKQRDVFFGHILVDADLAAQRHVEECLLAQAEMVEQGQKTIPRLGELLVKLGFATPQDIEQALTLQKALVRTCPTCGKSNNLAAADADRCASCKTPLEVSVHSTSLSLSASMELPPPAPVTEGPRRLGKYVFQGILGQGGCGVVFKALDSELNRIVALKLMHRDPGTGAHEESSEVERFVREARLAARLSHPNIVQVFEAGLIDQTHYIAMECIDGASMAKWRRSGSITIRQQVRVLRDAVLAVHAAHQQGITHRDLKPDNVLVDLRGKAYVMDFGLAKKAGGGDQSGSITVEGGLMGTPSYMSPEQARGKKNVSRLSDIWSLGIMLYEILSGRTPFKGNTPIETLMHILKDPIPSLASVAPTLMSGTLYRPLEAVCMRALQKEPGERYPSAKDFANDLTKWLKGDEVRVVQRRPSILNRKTAWIGGAAAAVFCVVLIAAMPSAAPKWTQNLQRAREALARDEPEEARAVYLAILEKAPGLAEAESGLKQAEAALKIRELQAQLDARKSAPDPVAPPGEEFPRSWLLIGDFPNGGLDAAHPPERGIDLRPGVQTWQLFTQAQITPSGGALINLLNRFRQNAHTTAYGLMHVWSPAATRVRLRVGSDDRGRIWVNRREVYRSDVDRGLVPDQDSVDNVALTQGWNQVLFKVIQGEGGFGFAFRVEGGQGLRYSSYGDLRR